MDILNDVVCEFDNPFDLDFKNIIDKYIKKNYPDNWMVAIKILNHIRVLEKNIRQAINTLGLNESDMDFHIYNIGYDKDGKLKAFDSNEETNLKLKALMEKLKFTGKPKIIDLTE